MRTVQQRLGRTYVAIMYARGAFWEGWVGPVVSPGVAAFPMLANSDLVYRVQSAARGWSISIDDGWPICTLRLKWSLCSRCVLARREADGGLSAWA